MKLVSLRNDSSARWTSKSLGLELDPGEVKKVHPATVKHPAVSSCIGRGLVLITSSEGEEPIAPITTTNPSYSPTPTVDTSEPKPEATPSVMDTPEKETAGSLCEAYLTAPGVTEENLQTLLETFPTFEALSQASNSQLQTLLSISKGTAKELLAWAKNKFNLPQ